MRIGIMEVHRASNLQQVCAGRSAARYTTWESRTLVLPLTTYVGPGCADLPPGEYILSGTIDMRDRAGTLKVLELRAETFEIRW